LTKEEKNETGNDSINNEAARYFALAQIHDIERVQLLYRGASQPAR
jgi:hypothetical protein